LLVRLFPIRTPMMAFVRSITDLPLTVQGDLDFVPFTQGSAEGTVCESPARKCRVRAR
jgi:hypothetical protein